MKRTGFFKRGPLFPFAFCIVYFALPPAQATVTNAFLQNYTIPYETIGTPAGTTVQFTIDELASIEVHVHRLIDVSDVPGPENLVASIQQNGLAAGSYTIFWNALWLVGGDVGRQNGNYQVIVEQTSGATPNSFTIPPLLQITSVDIHGVNVSPSFDANMNPALPYQISYALAKDSLVTIEAKNAFNVTVRTLLSNSPQFGEAIRTNSLLWDGLDDNGRPVPLGIYTIVLNANDPLSSDAAITRTRSATIQSLASLTSSPDKLFEANVSVYPNPVRNGQATFQFLAVRNNATITLKIYTLAGDLVRDETFPNLVTGNVVTFHWDAANEAGRKVGRGLYYYVVREEDSEGTLQTVKKLAVIP
ncbi:MAG: hypothetical protein A2992_01130 [Elusimicrobia bacterium RIFCSPLOWO2_01_FULL_59_12]|nr:MAG: hypothetical protein A2992_01130 [Elusimicrobia bacterium RIFCSPLOWO2_01_FULL_59_12]